jgi:hypothetical protein
MRYLERNIFNPVTNNSRALSLITLIFFLSALLLGAYLVSTEKGEIDPSKFTISQALAFGEKPIMIPLFALAMITTLLLNYVRGGEKFLLYLRYFLILLSYSLIIAIIYITTYKNKSLHYKFAGLIFLCQLLYVFVVSHLFNRYLDPDCNLLIAIDYNVILIICAFVLLVVFGIFEEDDSSEFENIIFASSENITVFLNLLPILYLGFV